MGCSTATAAEGASGIGTWMHRHAFYELNGTWLQRQMVAFDAVQFTVNLATPLATVTVPVGIISSLRRPTRNMLRIHDIILNRLLTTRESGFLSRNFATILSGLIPTEHGPSADAVMSFIDEHSVFFVEGKAPNPTLIPCGNTFCNDPSQAATPMPPRARPTPSNYAVQQPPTGAVTQLQRVALPLRDPDGIFPDADMASFLQQHIPPSPSPTAAPHRSEDAVSMAAS
ncbi:hypothetical protein LEN26_003168 [Aphanomyces euteiches]|nr:hypothetical protein LEN26_003168 [Aphanomyces euteiches]